MPGLAAALGDPARLPALDDDALRGLAPALIVAPHPDDESLGCAGLCVRLHALGLAAHLLLVSDGSGSHPGSRAWPAPRLAALRAAEAAEAWRRLGGHPAQIHALGLADRFVPAAGDDLFPQAVARARALVEALAPAAVVVPWRRDPHHDHRATWAILDAALADMSPRPRRLEYPIWTWEQPGEGAPPGAGEVTLWRLDLDAPARAAKQAAIAAHRSQLGLVIDDDPAGFVLTPAMLAHFAGPHEIFFEERPRH